MAASVLSKAGFKVTVLEKKRGPAAKLLIAGRSGLNVSNASPDKAIWKNYTGPQDHFQKIFEQFSVADWLSFINDLGIKTFLGATQRYFVEGLKAASLLKSWIRDLKSRGVDFLYGCELTDFHLTEDGKLALELNHDQSNLKKFSAVCLCLGGASFEPKETPLRWPQIFRNKGIGFTEFEAANAGYEVAWDKKFLEECSGKPLKNITITSRQGREYGEIMVTDYGLEGTPIYNLIQPQEIHIDLKPDISDENILRKMSGVKENLSPLRRAVKTLNLSLVAQSLLHHHAHESSKSDLINFSHLIKNFPVQLLGKRGLQESISSSGGVLWDELNESLMLKKTPGVFVAGEMLDWDAPTGGYLIQACASQGYWAGRGMVAYLRGLMSIVKV